MVMNRLKRGIALLLCASMIFTLVGCGKKDKEEKKSHVVNYEGKPNVTANSDTKWIDSEIYGAIDDSLVVSEKDDFYTAVNKDWFLEQKKPTDDEDDVTILMEGDEIVKDRLIKIVSGEEDPEAFDGSQVDIDKEELQHDQELVVQFITAAADWDKRNADGVTPLKRYVDDIASIATLDDMTDFMTDIEVRNSSQQNFIELETMAGPIDADYYRCIVAPDPQYALRESKSYKDINFSEMIDKRLTDRVVREILVKLGYDEAYADTVLKNCYKFEGMLVDHVNNHVNSDPEAYDKAYTLDELKKMAGRYPFEKIYNAYGFTNTDNIRIADRGYLKYMNRIYKQSNLELFKSYYIVHTIVNNIRLIDREYYDLVREAEEKYTANYKRPDKGDGDVKEVKIKDEWDLILNNFAMIYMAGPMNVVYISKYCSLEQKQDITNMIDEIIDHYHKLIDEEEWMSDTAREATHEKLDYMTVRAVYPDTLDDYKGLTFTDSDDLISMVQKIKIFETKNQAKKANQPVDRHLWNLGKNPTTTVNACYIPSDNSINIFAGIIAGENVFNVDDTDEENYARIGTIIGHEISHAFDSSGCYYDKYGHKKTWWDMDDLATFQLKVSKLSNYYNGISPFPGAKNLLGSKLSGEVIADMGGVSVNLMIAKEKEDFDYDLFFRSYAKLWRASRSLGVEASYAEQDVHPLGYLRTNVTLSQFDEFINTYDIKEGDGMYFAPENRIKVW